MLKAQYPYFKLELLRQKGYAVNQYRIAGQGTYNNWRLNRKICGDTEAWLPEAAV